MSEYPSLPDQGKNLAKFGWDMLQHVFKNQDKTLFVSEEVYQERTEICKSCDRFDAQQSRCMECGCFIPAKAKMILDSCPMDKWKADELSWNEKFNNIVKDIEEPKE